MYKKNTFLTLFFYLTLLFLLYAILFLRTDGTVNASEKVASEINDSHEVITQYKSDKNKAMLGVENKISSDEYQKNGMTYIEPLDILIYGGLGQNYQRLKLEAEGGNSESAYLLGVNLSRCLSAPSSPEELQASIEFNKNSIPREAKKYSDIVSSLDAGDIRDYYYCEGISREEGAEFYKYIKLSIAGGYVYAAGPDLNFYGLVEFRNKNASDEEKEKMVNEYYSEYKEFMTHASEHGGLQAMRVLGQMYIDEYTASKDSRSAVEALKYYLVLKEYAESEYQSTAQRYIEMQLNLLNQQEVFDAESKAKKLKNEIVKNGKIYKINMRNN